ncbi:CRISPR-associated RAMP protein, Csm4 family [Hydrogenimonas sp.]|nr:CRISPR-associated RAMP protein, Csm4 family [Hydrogenimonas sp.]
METVRAQIEPLSEFGTPLRGDTLFGQICWTIALLDGEERLKSLLDDYDRNPFLIVSDPFPPGLLPKPAMPYFQLGEDPEERKINRDKRWISMSDLKAGRFNEALSNHEAGLGDVSTVTLHNSLDYRSFKTGGAQFAPFGEKRYLLGKKEIYLMFDRSKAASEDVHRWLEAVGLYGYGKDASIGKGRYSLVETETVELPMEGERFMTLSPASLEGVEAVNVRYRPMTRFGKHGGKRARGKVFKKPLLLADTGAVLDFDSPRTLPYAGKAIRGHSSAHPDTVHQGYAVTVAIGKGDAS